MAGRRRSKGSPYQRPDANTQAAKASGYPARSVFKLEEIDKRVRLLRPGLRVLDLGAAPGSWSLYAAQRVGAKGLVVAIDLSEIRQAMPPQVVVIQDDATTCPAIVENAPYDVVISDMAPATSGNRMRDQALSYELCAFAIEQALEHLGPGGAFVGKIFMSDDFIRARDRLRSGFEQVKTIKPSGTRSNSVEVFLIGLGRRAAAEPAP